MDSSKTFAAMYEKLVAPFPIDEIEFRPGALSKDRSKSLALPYADIRVYQERLDETVGPENWSVEYRPISENAIFCRLNILGVVREDVGECYKLTKEGTPDENRTCTAVAQAFKRACSAFGIGRYIYSLPQIWGDFDAQKKQFVNPLALAQEIYRRAGYSVGKLDPNKTSRSYQNYPQTNTRREEPVAPPRSERQDIVEPILSHHTLETPKTSAPTRNLRPTERTQPQPEEQPTRHRQTEPAPTARPSRVEEQAPPRQAEVRPVTTRRQAEPPVPEAQERPVAARRQAEPVEPPPANRRQTSSQERPATARPQAEPVEAPIIARRTPAQAEERPAPPKQPEQNNTRRIAETPVSSTPPAQPSRAVPPQRPTTPTSRPPEERPQQRAEDYRQNNRVTPTPTRQSSDAVSRKEPTKPKF